MVVLPLTNTSSYNLSLHTNLKQTPDFSKAIQNDVELFFLLNVMLKAFPAQLKLFEELHIYDELEKGEVFEELSERSVTMSLNEGVDLLKILAKHSYYREESFRLHKVCQGHFDEIVKREQPFRGQEHAEKVEQKILQEWEQKKEIKPDSIKIKQVQYRNLSLIKKLCDFYMSYTHVDNYKGCSSPVVKKQTVQDLCFTSVLDHFKTKINTYNLNPESEWTALVQKVFGPNLNVT